MKMVRIKTADLVGRPLDWAVAKAIGHKDFDGYCPVKQHLGECGISDLPFTPSTDWADGGPLFDAHIEYMVWYEEWLIHVGIGGGEGLSPTKLRAACRAIVSARLGDEVDVPAELVKEKAA